ncbi:hypothetical protein Si064_00421 [Streptococcus infantarius subsp. infantarius]|nr:hypothetical protein [Streptococcus infantarius subsp. infantarius]
MTRENHLMEWLSKAYASLPDSEPLKADIFALAKDLEKKRTRSTSTYQTGSCHFYVFANA